MDYDDGLIGDESPPRPDDTPAAVDVAETPPEAPEPFTDPADPAPAPPVEKPDAVQRRIDQLTAARRQAENEAAYWRGQAEAKGQPPQAPTQATTPEGEPQDSDFETQAAYIAALHRYHAKQALDAEQATRAEQAQQQAQRQTQAQQHAAIQAREAELLQTHPDYYERCQAVVQQIAPHVKWGLEHSGAHGPDLVLYLHEHPEDVQRLNQTPPHALGIELGMLRAKAPGGPMAASPDPPRAPKPEPPTPIPGGGRTASPDTYREDMTQQAYEAWRRKTSTLYRSRPGT